MSEIRICDLCKSKQDKKTKMFDLIVSLAGKKKANYELCKKCKDNLIQRLDNLTPPEETFIHKRPAKKEEPIVEFNEGGDRDAKIRALESGANPPNARDSVSTPTVTKSEMTEYFEVDEEKAKNCRHRNKGKLQGIGPDSVPYQICKDCGVKVPFKRPYNPDAVIRGAPKGVNLKDA